MKRKAVVIQGLDIEIRPYKPVGFRPKTAIIGISSEGIVGPLVASQLVAQLGMDQVCALESSMFPPTAMVYFQKPKFPARIYASKEDGLAVFLAEFAPMDELARPLAYAVLAWCEANGVERIIAIEGFLAQSSSPGGVSLAAIGSTAADRKAVAAAGIPEVRNGALNGVAGVLLNEGQWQSRRVIALMAAVTGADHDVDGAIEALGAIQRLLPKLPLHKRKSKSPTQLERAILAARERKLPLDFI